MKDPLRSLPGYALRRASAAMMEDLGQRLSELDLRTTEVSVLILIDANPGVTQSGLCRALGIQRANMTPLIARLDKRSLLERTAVDGRSHGLALTKSGKALLAQARTTISAHEDNLWARVPKEHRAHLVPALQALWND